MTNVATATDLGAVRVEYVRLLQTEANRCDRIGRRLNAWYTGLRTLVITFGAAIPVLTAVGASPWISAGLGASIVAAEGIQQLFKFRENALVYFRASNALDQEYRLFVTRSSPYDGAGSFGLLVQRVEPVRSVAAKDVLAALTPDQTPGGRPATAGSVGSTGT